MSTTTEPKFKFRKVDGQWQRRRNGSKERWKTLRVTKVVDRQRLKFTQRDGTVIKEDIHRNKWDWV